MTITLAIMCVLSALGWIAAAIMAWKFVWLGRRYVELEDQVEESLDLLDTHYGRLAKVLEVPVASDDPFAREAVAAIKDAHDAVLLVANKLTVHTTGEEDEEVNDMRS